MIGCGSADATSPRMLTLDSTVPDWVAATAGSIDPARTLFAVSSKSGTTTEPLTFYAYFRDLADTALGVEAAGDNFIAVTDPGTPLAKQAATDNFRRAFLNNPDIGGRYSVLSYFGLVSSRSNGRESGPVGRLGRTDAAALSRGGTRFRQPRHSARRYDRNHGRRRQGQAHADRQRRHRCFRVVGGTTPGGEHWQGRHGRSASGDGNRWRTPRAGTMATIASSSNSGWVPTTTSPPTDWLKTCGRAATQ